MLFRWWYIPVIAFAFFLVHMGWKCWRWRCSLGIEEDNNRNNMFNINNINNHRSTSPPRYSQYSVGGQTCKRLTIAFKQNERYVVESVEPQLVLCGLSSLIPISIRYCTDNSDSKLRSSVFASVCKYQDGTTFL